MSEIECARLGVRFDDGGDVHPALVESTGKIRYPLAGELYLDPRGHIVRAEVDKRSYAAPIFVEKGGA